MKYKISVPSLVMIFAAAVSYADAQPSTRVIDSSTGDAIILTCETPNTELHACTKFLLNSEVNLSSDETQKDTQLLGAYDLNQMRGILAILESAKNNSRPPLLFNLHAPQIEPEPTPGYFFEITDAVWEGVADPTWGAPVEVVTVVGAAVATPVTLAADIVAGVAVDGAAVVSYPARALIRSLTSPRAKAYRTMKMLLRLENGKSKSIGHEAFVQLKDAIKGLH